MSGLNPEERTRLVKILGKLGSEFAGERAAAGLAANGFLKHRDLSWDDVVVAASRPSPSKPPYWKQTAHRCLQHKHLLTPGQTRHCANLELLDSVSSTDLETLSSILKTLWAAGVAT
jgi:hypothetical protein